MSDNIPIETALGALTDVRLALSAVFDVEDEDDEEGVEGGKG